MSVFALCYQWNIENNNLLNDDNNNLNKNISANKNELNFFIDRLVNILDSNNFFIPNSKTKEYVEKYRSYIYEK